jgi:hypothetical protein
MTERRPLPPGYLAMLVGLSALGGPDLVPVRRTPSPVPPPPEPRTPAAPSVPLTDEQKASLDEYYRILAENRERDRLAAEASALASMPRSAKVAIEAAAKKRERRRTRGW